MRIIFLDEDRATCIIGCYKLEPLRNVANMCRSLKPILCLKLL